MLKSDSNARYQKVPNLINPCSLFIVLCSLFTVHCSLSPLTIPYFRVMQTKEAILQLLDQYQLHFPDEAEGINAFQHFLSSHDSEQLYSRKNFNGHITASAFILNETLDSVLLLNHKKLNRWLQPGGHIDDADSSLMAAALRETEEETGLNSREINVIHTHDDNSIFDIDSHLIPANINKSEPAHVHHDLRFLFKCLQPGLININMMESTDFKWVSLTELCNDLTFGMVAHKIIRLV